MSEFEYLAVLISIIVGLGVTHILFGLARIIHMRDSIQISVLHLVWTLNILLILLLNWWILFLWSGYPHWSYDVYLLLIGWGVALYMLAVVLYPPDLQAVESYAEVFERNRVWLFSIFIIFIGFDIAQSAVRGELMDPPIYLPYVLHYALLAAIGIRTNNPRYQRFFAWYTLITLVLWSMVVRRALGD